jgi:8-oxo-dGTP diphosphatase
VAPRCDGCQSVHVFAGSGDGFVRCSDGVVRWGRFGAAGALFVVRAEFPSGPIVSSGAAVMLQQRSLMAHEGGTWSCAGGALAAGETTLAGALREAAEEVGGLPGDFALLGEHVFEPAVDWRYTTHVIDVRRPFGFAATFETDAVDWVALDEVDRLPLHPGFAAAWPHLRAIIDRSGPSPWYS